jgi:hypothetical protein
VCHFDILVCLKVTAVPPNCNSWEGRGKIGSHSLHWPVWLHAPEEIHHAFLQFRLEAGHIPTSVNLTKRHPPFIFKPPETRQQDRAGQEVILAIVLLEHDRQIILYHPPCHLHRVFDQGSFNNVELLPREQVVHSDGSLDKERGVSLGEIGAEFFEELTGAVEGTWVGAVAFGTALFDASGFVGVESCVVVVEFYVI